MVGFVGGLYLVGEHNKFGRAVSCLSSLYFAVDITLKPSGRLFFFSSSNSSLLAKYDQNMTILCFL